MLSNHTTYLLWMDRYVVGEVYNNTPYYIKSFKITVNFFNGSQLVATDYRYVHLANLHPYEKTCFEVSETDPPDVWTHYAFEPVGYHTGGTPRPNLVVSTHSGGRSGTDSYQILGFVRNDGAVQVQSASALATLYDSGGKVLGCEFSDVSSTNLEPGQASSFDIRVFPSDPSLVATYSLQTDGDR